MPLTYDETLYLKALEEVWLRAAMATESASKGAIPAAQVKLLGRAVQRVRKLRAELPED